jgi:hypothetical protein
METRERSRLRRALIAIERPIIMLVLCMLSSMARAEDAKFTSASLPYRDALHLIEERDGHQFIFGSTIAFTISADAGDFFRKPFLIRLFRVDPKKRHEPQQLASFRPCLVFFSRPLVFSSGTSGATVVIGMAESFHWLTPWPDGRLDDGHFLLVFEPLNDKSKLLRLDESYSDAYFQAGIYIDVVRQQEQSYPKETIAKAAAEMFVEGASLAAQVKKNGPEFHCYKPKAIASTTIDDFDVSVACTGSQDIEGRNRSIGPDLAVFNPPIQAN